MGKPRTYQKYTQESIDAAINEVLRNSTSIRKVAFLQNILRKMLLDKTNNKHPFKKW